MGEGTLSLSLTPCVSAAHTRTRTHTRTDRQTHIVDATEGRAVKGGPYAACLR